MKTIKENAPRYRRADKRHKSQILEELTVILGYNRTYLAFLLRNSGKVIVTPQGVRLIADPEVTLVSRRGRKKIYPDEITAYLKTLWELSGCISSKHLRVFIRSNQDFIFTSPRLKGISSRMKGMLLTISPASIERRLAVVREKEELRGRYKTNPYASNIKKRIPVQTHFDKPRASFDLAEIDLVFHCGESTQGEFAYTLTVTEITSGWTELRVIQNRAQVWSVGALKEVVDSLPFKVVAIHSDNGSEFINAFLPHKPTSCSCGDPRCDPLFKEQREHK